MGSPCQPCQRQIPHLTLCPRVPSPPGCGREKHVSCCLSCETPVFYTRLKDTPHLMIALPPVRPSDCSVVLCKAALPVTCEGVQDILLTLC